MMKTMNRKDDDKREMILAQIQEMPAGPLSFVAARLALISLVALLLGAAAIFTTMPGCAVLAGAAAGGATGYVAGHEAAKHETQSP